MLNKIIMNSLFFAMVFNFFSCNNDVDTIIQKPKTQDQIFNEKQSVMHIKKAYYKLSLYPNSMKYQEEYFNVFPNTFF